MRPLIAPIDTPALLSRAATLHADLMSLCDQSLALIHRGRDRRLTATYPLLRAIRGGSDVGLVTQTLTGVFLCAQCVAKKTGLPPGDVDSVLKTIARTLRLGIGTRRCHGCLSVKATFSAITNNGEAGPSRSPKPLVVGQLVFPYDLQPGDIVVDGDIRLSIVGRPMSVSGGRMTYARVRRDDETGERDAMWETWRKVRVVRPPAA